MSPLYCSKGFLEYDDCLNCRNRYNNDCCATRGMPEKLADILTIQERIAILEDKRVEVAQPEWTKKQWDIVLQLQAEVRGWRQKHTEMMIAVDKLTNKGKKAGDYEYNKISEGE